ncbi:hypothetical protein F5Y15DRAFT_321351 [Xylariaceae sp. FL0016]|nr:hypothetical protein F5Y15DRAFT_321351 [Xylariaceae sp. FL0016]
MITPLVALKKRSRSRHARAIARRKRRVSGEQRSAPVTRASGLRAAATMNAQPPQGELANQEPSPAYLPKDGQTFRKKVPLSERADPLIGPGKKFNDIQDYFFTLLRTKGVNIDDILDSNFENNEIILIHPATSPQDLVDWQQRNSTQYQQLLDGRFKGSVASLQFKFACLYFGLPVEPMRFGFNPPAHMPMDIDLDEEGNNNLPAPQEDPLEFLDDFRAGRTPGLGASGFSRGFFRDAQSKPPPPLRLRGGGDEIDDDGMDFGWDEDEGDDFKPGSMEYYYGHAQMVGQDPPPEDRPHVAINAAIPPKHDNEETTHIDVYGYEGMSRTPDRSYVSGQDYAIAARRLLRCGDNNAIRICLEVWDRETATRQKYVQGMLNHASTNATFHDLLHGYFDMGKAQTYNKYACFVHLHDEKHPHHYEPLASNDRYIVRVNNQESGDLGYMKVPPQIRPEHMHHQFSKSFGRCVTGLYPKQPHSYTTYRTSAQQNPYASYGWLDPSNGIWAAISRLQGNQTQLPTLELREDTTRPAEDQVPIFMPGLQRPGFNTNRHCTNTAKLTSSGDDHIDEENIHQLWNTFDRVDNYVQGEIRFMGYGVWAPASNMLSTAHDEYYLDRRQVVADPANQYRQFLKTLNLDSKVPKSMMITPKYSNYWVRKDSVQETPRFQLTRDMTLEQFQDSVRRNLYNNYDPKNKNHAIYLQLFTFAINQSRFVIRSETTGCEWKVIKRCFTEPDIVVTFRDNDPYSWSVPECQNSVWGPRYDMSEEDRTKLFGSTTNNNQGTNGNTSSNSNAMPQIPVQIQPASLTNDISNWPRASDNNRETHEQDRQQRNTFFQQGGNQRRHFNPLPDKKYFLDEESIFANPLKPAIPMRGTFIEPVLQTGPSVLGVTLAVATPTETVRLRREVQSLRYELLDKTRACPFVGCNTTFLYNEREGLDQHILTEHSILQCVFCQRQSRANQLMPYYDQQQILKHFAESHADEYYRLLSDTGRGGTVDTSGPTGSNTTPASNDPPEEPSWDRFVSSILIFF